MPCGRGTYRTPIPGLEPRDSRREGHRLLTRLAQPSGAEMSLNRPQIAARLGGLADGLLAAVKEDGPFPSVAAAGAAPPLRRPCAAPPLRRPCAAPPLRRAAPAQLRLHALGCATDAPPYLLLPTRRAHCAADGAAARRQRC